jgi:polar amino acid transport system substrate-binding protein
MRAFPSIAIVAAVVASGVALVAGQHTPAEPVFTAEQVAVGKVVYARSCAACHMPDLSGNVEYPALAGPSFMSMWGTRTTKDLFDYMSASMPYGAPSLSPESYAAITAFILQSNGAVAGADPLSASTAVPIGSVSASPKTTTP